MFILVERKGRAEPTLRALAIGVTSPPELNQMKLKATHSAHGRPCAQPTKGYGGKNGIQNQSKQRPAPVLTLHFI